MKGLYAEALDHVEKAKALSGDDLRSLAHAGWIHGLKGDRSGATAVAQELEDLSRRRYVPPFLVALVYRGLKDNAKALDWLEVGLSERDLLLTTLMVDPRFETLRSEPRFQAILTRWGSPVADAYRSRGHEGSSPAILPLATATTNCVGELR